MTARNQPGLPKSRFVSRILFACVLCTLVLAQPEGKQLTIYAPQASYSVPIIERGGLEYADLVGTLEPLGSVSTKIEGRKLKLSFNKSQGEFTQEKTKSKLAKKSIDLPAPFRIEDNRGLLPLSAVPQVLSALTGMTPDYHATSRRLFLNGTATRYTVDTKKDPSRLVFTFTSPVNPVIATDAGHLRMTFRREPLLGSAPANYDGKQVAFSEQNGVAQIDVATGIPLIASFGDGARTITLTPVAPPSVPAQAAVPAPIPPMIGSAAPAQPPPRPRNAVVIDPAHGGDDTGATLAPGVYEKDITLAFARRLHQELETRGIVALILRNNDVSIAPEQRASSANASGASLYVALHASASGAGVRIFTFPFSEAVTRSVTFIPWDEAQRRFLQASSTAASALVTQFLKQDLPSQAIAAPVRPLNNIAASAVAVEVEPPPSADAEALQSPEYQKTVAAAIAAAIAGLHPEAR
jgi:N-acetylmuramoyl-L-alanine amidase